MSSEQPKVGDSFYIREDAWPATEIASVQSGEITKILANDEYGVEMDDYTLSTVHISEIEVVR